MKHIEKLVKLVELLEIRHWTYTMMNDRIQVELGNYFYNISKYDSNQLQQIIDDIEQW